MLENAVRPFFIRSAIIDSGLLSVEMGGDAEAWGCIEFPFVRAFLFFKESDLWKRLANYDHRRLIDGGERTLGVFTIMGSPLLGGIFDETLASEKPSYFWLSTPDECLEVIGFEQPVLKLR